MRATKSILLAALLLAFAQAQQTEQQAKQAAFEANNNGNTQNHKPEPKKQQQQQQGPPQELSPEEFELAKEGIRQILVQLPIQHVEPLVNTMEGYCSTFEVLCTAACKERMNGADEDSEAPTTVRLGCANPGALTIGTASASCRCASYDMTDRINFAIVGGIVSSHGKKGDFGAEGILDAIKFLPAVPTFLSIIHVLQTVCYYVSFLDVLATNANPTCPADGKSNGVVGAISNAIGGIVSGIPGIGGLLGGLLGGGSTPAPSTGGIGGLLGSLFGGGGGSKTPTPTPTPTPTSGGGGIGGFLSGIFGGGGGSNTTPTKSTTAPTATATSQAGGIAGFFDGLFGSPKTTTTTTIATPKTAIATTALTNVSITPSASAAVSNGGTTRQQNGPTPTTTIVSTTASPSPTPKKFFFGLFSETDDNGNLFESNDVDSGAEGTGGEGDEDVDAKRLVSNDGRVARIVRIQKRYAEKKQQKQEHRDDL
ncbi:hypothetical protein EC991_011447 [Linnemannia zychae]|nr:hypothetical protein EC991_011447 [Linnemannia zychae]